MVNQITTVEQFQTAISSSKLVVVDFFAVWCGPCKMIAPLLERFSNEYAETTEFYKLDVDELSSVAQEQEVTAMPTIIFYRDGKVVDKVIGANPNAIKQKITANL
jgi:thioredoxin 1